jgi:hypothetical protein
MLIADDADCRAMFIFILSKLQILVNWRGSLCSKLRSPDFLYFLGLDKGRHPGLPSGVAEVMRPSTAKE